MNPDVFDLSDIPPEQLSSFVIGAVTSSIAFDHTSCTLLVPDGSGVEITRFTAEKMHWQIFSVAQQFNEVGAWEVVLTWEEP